MAEKGKGKKDKDKKKPSIMKGNSPWESRAIREKRGMRPAETKIHRAFVAGKRAARAEMKATGKTPARTVSKIVSSAQAARQRDILPGMKLPNKTIIKGIKGNNSAWDVPGAKAIASNASKDMKVRKTAAYNMGEARAKQQARKKRYGYKQSGNK